MSGLYLGIDVGSTTVKLVVLDELHRLIDSHYVRSHGKPRRTLFDLARTVSGRFPGIPIQGAGLTGSGGAPIREQIGGFHVNELVAQTRSVGRFHPEARTIIEIGGQDSKLMLVQWDEFSRQMVLLDFAMNTLCAAGTGSFLDQQAERLGISIEDEFAPLALASEHPARIAGRCTVFAKSDMIHLQQQGTPLADILSGLCHALARNFKSVIGKGKPFTPPVLFQGGVSNNRAVVRAFESVLGLPPGAVTVPSYQNYMAALGAVYTVIDEERAGKTYPFHGFERLASSMDTELETASLPGLTAYTRCMNGHAGAYDSGKENRPVYLGVDVGSISTCIVLIDGENRLIAHRYLPTGGNALAAVRQGFAGISAEAGTQVQVAAAGVTGSGRYLVGHFIGADTIRNEITAQARAASAADADVDTIFEIGGQDSKYIRMYQGAVVDFAMNNACAAGTGSFLEEQADRLGISITQDFAELALAAPAPVSLGERCTVFMESDLVHHQQRGATVPDLTAGLSYSIVSNYLNRVVNGRPIGRRVFFQGGVASNHSVAAAFEQVLQRPIVVPAHNELTGAVGAAILAREEMNGRKNITSSRFKGFILDDWNYESSVFTCQACPNLCEVRKIVIRNEPPMYFDARCDKFEEAGRSRRHRSIEVPDLFTEREQLLLDGYTEPVGRRKGRRVGIPRALFFHDLFPFWHAFFQYLNFDVVLSEATNRRIVLESQVHAVPECCFPIRLLYGHVVDLFGRDVDFVFIPSLLDRESLDGEAVYNKYCPLVSASGQMVKNHLDFKRAGIQPLAFPVHLSSRRALRVELPRVARQLDRSDRAVMKAAEAGFEALSCFCERIRKRGDQVMQSVPPDVVPVVLVGRPYNTCDPGVCLDLPLKLRRLGALPVPMDFLSIDSVDIAEQHADMYWRSGRDILAAARLIEADSRLHAVYLTSFECGPDSFLISYFRRLMGRKPFLELEIDDHTAEAGLVTRCEAFLDSLNRTR